MKSRFKTARRFLLFWTLFVCADNGSDGGALPICGKEKVDAGGKRNTEKSEQKDIQKQKQNVRAGKIPAHFKLI